MRLSGPNRPGANPDGLDGGQQLVASQASPPPLPVGTTQINLYQRVVTISLDFAYLERFRSD
jgi:hypothetical protein